MLPSIPFDRETQHSHLQTKNKIYLHVFSHKIVETHPKTIKSLSTYLLLTALCSYLLLRCELENDIEKIYCAV